jgi:chromosome segregation protein
MLPERAALVTSTQRVEGEAELQLTQARDRLAELEATLQEAEIEARSAEQRGGAAQLRFDEALAGIREAEQALAGLAKLRADLQVTHDRAVAVAETALHAAEYAAKWAAEADEHADVARMKAAEGEQMLNDLRTRERQLATSLEELSRLRNQAEVRRAESRARGEALAERAMEEWALSREALIQIAPLETETEELARQRVEILDRDMRRMGPVNPRAAEEYAELAERETFLVEQIEDLKASRRDLMKVVQEVDETIVTVFGEAFERVAAEFEGVFQRLFPGGTGALKLTDPDDLLGSGIEVEARPPGKNVRKLSLLSGGERSLVALAFLFSIFRSHPSPFYLLDEVEAALDDFNLQRFIGLVQELEERAQILIVTHQKRTMESADVLYGVSMGKDGVSQVVAKRMEAEEPTRV